MQTPRQSPAAAAPIRPLPKPATQTFTIIAQDPGVRDRNGNIVRAKVQIPAEELQPGPWGYRVQVVDYDAASDTLWAARQYQPDASGNLLIDPFKSASDAVLLSDPTFHQQNVYAIVMRI